MIKNILNGVIIMLAWWVWSWIILWALNALSIVKIEPNSTNSLALAVLMNGVMLMVAVLIRLGGN